MPALDTSGWLPELQCSPVSQGAACDPNDPPHTLRSSVGVAQDIELVLEETPAGSLCGVCLGVSYRRVFLTPTLLRGCTVRGGTRRSRLRGVRLVGPVLPGGNLQRLPIRLQPREASAIDAHVLRRWKGPPPTGEANIRGQRPCSGRSARAEGQGARRSRPTAATTAADGPRAQRQRT